MEDNERITIRVPRGMKRRLDKRIKDEDMFASRSELIRHLLQNFLAESNRRIGKRRIR